MTCRKSIVISTRAFFSFYYFSLITNNSFTPCNFHAILHVSRVLLVFPFVRLDRVHHGGADLPRPSATHQEHLPPHQRPPLPLPSDEVGHRRGHDARRSRIGVQPAVRVVRHGEGRHGHEGRRGRGGAVDGGPPLPILPRAIRVEVHLAGTVPGQDHLRVAGPRVVYPSGFPEGIAEEDPEEGSGQVLREEVGGQGGVEQGGRVALMGIVLVDVADWSAHFFPE